ncbi:17464_t:CDS:10 [Racocetra fulgida]|uniref:17464_t:CDS:1 n=1 Tax=Racocetra fulgida TaxID=60492 RepID=A0A9N9B571_9GLOM|nr:17464_t:CDS:10 [Racocetra fulgida]
MIKPIEDKDKIIKNSINFIWKATSGKAATVIFNNDSLLTATLTLNDGTPSIINLDAPSCVIINRENFLKIVNLADVNEIIIDDEDHEAIQTEDMNINRQPSDLSLESMDIQGSNTKDINVDDMEDNEASRFDDNSSNSMSQPLEEGEVIQKNKAQNLNSNNQELVDSGSDEYDDTDEEIDERIFDALTSSLSSKSSTYRKAQDNTTKHKSKINEVFKVAKNNYAKDDKHSGIERVPLTLTEDSPLPSVKDALSVLQEPSLNREYNDNNKSDIENERTSIINEPPNIGPKGVPFVFVNDPIPVEDNDSDEEIRDLIRKRKFEINYNASKKAKKNDTNIKTKHNNENSHGGEQNNDVEILSEGSSLSGIEVFLVTISIPSFVDKGFNDSSDNSSNKFNESTLIIDNLSKITLENSQQANNSIDENHTSVYVDRLKKLRNNADNFAAEDPSNLFEMYSQPPEKYFEEDLTKISLNPLPSHIKDVNGFKQKSYESLEREQYKNTNV